MIDIETVRSVLSGHPLVEHVDRLQGGHDRIETALLYPDGNSIDLFVLGGHPFLDDIVLSDLGQTTGWLNDALAPIRHSERRRAILDDILRIHGVVLNGGALETRCSGVDDLARGIVTLGQACLRTSDLWFVGSRRRPTKFRAQVGEVIDQTRIASGSIASKVRPAATR